MPKIIKVRTDSDEDFEVLDISGMAKNGKNGSNWLEKYLGDITKASAAKQMAVGGGSGWVAGFVFIKVGKMAAMSIGGSLLLLQVATHQGFIKVNWNKVNTQVSRAKKQIEKHASRRLPWILEEAEDFVKENIFLATGFAGGFLLGIASS